MNAHNDPPGQLEDVAINALSGGMAAMALSIARRAVEIPDCGVVLGEYPGAVWAEPAHARHIMLLRQARHAVATAALHRDRRGQRGAG